MVSGSADRTIKFWSSNGDLLQSIDGLNAWGLSVAVADNTMVSCVDSPANMILIWNIEGLVAERK